MIIQFRNSLYNNKALDLNANAEIGYLNQIILRPNVFYCQKLPFLTETIFVLLSPLPQSCPEPTAIIEFCC